MDSSLLSSSGLQVGFPAPHLPTITHANTSAAVEAQGGLRLRILHVISTSHFRDISGPTMKLRVTVA